MSIYVRSWTVFYFLTVVLILQSFWGVSSSESARSFAPFPLQVAQASAPVPEVAVEDVVDEKKPVKINLYEPGGRPDPFQPFLVLDSQKNKQKLLPPLERSDVNELKLIAVIWGNMGRTAMLQTPDGKGYTVKMGARVGSKNGVVKKITPKEVIVEERYKDLFGRNQTRLAILKLRPEGDNRR